jgi:hypothetical protein
VPAFNFSYQEKGTDIAWRCTCGGTRAYLIRFGTPLSHDMDEQAAESHFMARRITASLLLSGFGLFIPEPTGRVLFTDVWGDAVNFTAQLVIIRVPNYMRFRRIANEPFTGGSAH